MPFGTLKDMWFEVTCQRPAKFSNCGDRYGILMEAEVLGTVCECYESLRSGNNDGIQRATCWLNEFYTQPGSVQVLIDFIKGSKDEVSRRHAIIGLSKATSNVWMDIPADVREKIFVELLHLLTHEVDWKNRQNLIDVIGTLMAEAYEKTVLAFVVQSAESGQDAFLEMALLLASLIASNQEANAVMLGILERGFSSPQPLLRTAAFHFILNSKPDISNSFFEQFPAYWNSLLEVLNDFASKNFELKRITGLFSKAIQEKLCPGYPESLLALCLSFYERYKAAGNLEPFRDLHLVILDICQVYYQEIISSGKLQPILAVYFDWSVSVFDPKDTYAVSDSIVFEPVVHSLCRTVDAVEEMCRVCTSMGDSIPSKFIFLRCIGETVFTVPTFYESRLGEIVNLAKSAFASGTVLLAEAAGRTVCDLLNFCSYQKEEFALEMIPVVFRACQELPSSELLNVCAKLLGAIHGTDDLFDDIFQVLIRFLKSGSVDVQYGALKCIGALAKGSKLKIGAAAATLLQEILQILQSNNEAIDILKAPAVDSLGKVAQVVTLSLDEPFPSLILLLITHIDSDDVSLAISCLNAIESLIWCNPDIMAPSLEVLLPKLIQRATFDVSEAYMKSLVEAQPLQYSLFSVTSSCLRILAKLTVKYPQSFEKVSEVVIQSCEVHKMSPCSSELKVAVAKSVKYLANSAARVWDAARVGSSIQETGVKRLCGILVKMFTPEADPEVLCEILRSMRTIMLYFGFYDIGDEYIAFFIETSREIIEQIDKDNYRPIDLHHDIFESLFLFVDSLCQSAGKVSVGKLTSLIEIFVKLAQDHSLRYRSLAMRFLGILAASGLEKVNRDLTMETVLFALQMAKNDLDFAPFWALKKLIQYAKDVIQPFVGELYTIFMTRLNEEHLRSERSLRFRDNCVSSFIMLILRFYEDPNECNLDECLPVILKALPLTVDLESSHTVFRFLDLVHDKLETSFKEEYFRVLVELFSSSDLTLKEMSIDKYCQLLQTHLVTIVSSLPNAEQVCAELCKNDPVKIQNLKRRIEEHTPPV